MPTVAVNKNVPIPTAHQGSILRPSTDADDVRQQWKRASNQREQTVSDRVALEQLIRKVEQMRRRILGGSGGSGGINWQTPYKELDPKVAVSAGTLVYISPQNSIVTAGIMDLVQLVILTAMAGTWLCVLDVPAQVTISSVIQYNVPQTLTQGPPTGTPLKGDADSPSVFWIPIAGVMNCG